MTKAGINLTINGFTEYIEALQNVGKNVDDAAIMALNKTGNRAMREMSIGIKKHRKTGHTQAQLIMPQVKRERDGLYSVEVGFKLPEGLGARYVNRGTPTNKKDPFVDRALNKSKIKAEQRELFEAITRGYL